MPMTRAPLFRRPATLSWPLLASILTTLATLCLAESAHGFCRTTTCDPEEELCPVNDDGCRVTGTPLYWPDLCVNFAVQAGGSTLRGISAKQTQRALERAFQTWISADCGGGRTPSLGAVSLGEVHCSEVEFNQDGFDKDGERRVDGPNANLVVYRDELWPHAGEGNKLGVTTVTFVPSTGEILDADIELNALGTEFTTSDDLVRTDLQSVLTHEVGHFLGLAHSFAPGATMNPEYDAGNLDFRSLSEDDRNAICAAYPPLEEAEQGAGGESPTGIVDCRGSDPRYGYSRYCGEPVLADGCALTLAKNNGQTTFWLVGIGLVMTLWGRRRRSP